MINLRLLWTWDHCTQWTAARAGVHDYGASNEFSGTAEDFVREYSLLLRWCGRHGIDGVVVWGLLRDGHGGVEAARRLCEVADQAGVKLLAGVGLNAYGGVYYEGDSEWSLNNHLRKHPELHAVRANGQRHICHVPGNSPQPFHHACPSRPENLAYCLDSLRWLMETVSVHGVQVESGDTHVCECRLCRERRQHPVSALSWDDMALFYGPAAEAVGSVRPDATVVLETYSHPEPVTDGTVPGFGGGSPPSVAQCLAQFPRRAYVQWVADHFCAPRRSAPWTARAPAGFAGNIMRAHLATWWMGRGDEVAVDWLAQLAQQSLAHGFNGLSIFGEKSPFRTGCELNYLALADYGSAANPGADLESFLTRVAAPLLGGPERAAEFLRLARLIGAPEELERAAAQARRHAAQLDGRPAGRWTWLAWYLSRWLYDAQG
ncbi:MAG: hypothetical protein FJ280_18440 [Planctomycetes bacterium]|nr:hypothetical protein [Planctomycetota bacterium]